MADKGGFIGKQLGSYRIVAELNSGSYGSVYTGKHLIFVDEPIVAIKVLHAHLNSLQEREEFIQEAQLLKKLKHSFILPILDASIQDGMAYIVTEYASRGSLRDRLRQRLNQPFPLEEALTLLSQVGQALYHAHQQNIVHRDLKPENILFNAKGEALLADFGIARVLATAGTKLLGSSGTPAYMAPEQFEGMVSMKSDQYALGCIAYELLAGRRPFVVENAFIEAIWYQHAKVDPVALTKLNPHLPIHIEQTILKAMAKQRTDRHADVSVFLTALQKPLELRLDNEEDIVEELTGFTNLLVHETPSALESIANTRQVYGKKAFESAINNEHYLSTLHALLQGQETRPLLLVWQHIGPYVQPAPASWGLLLTSFTVLKELWSRGSKESKALLDAMTQAMAGREKAWLQLAVDYSTSVPGNTLERFYSRMMYPIAVDQCMPYRKIMQKVTSDPLLYELYYDVSKADAVQGPKVLKQFVLYAQQWYPQSVPTIVDEGISLLKEKHAQQWGELAPLLLNSRTLEPYLSKWKDQLIDTALAAVSFSRFNDADIEMCRIYQHRAGLSQETQLVIDGILAMTSGRLDDDDLGRRLHKHFAALPAKRYQAEADRFIAEFVQSPFTPESHTRMINALHEDQNDQHFWSSYWNAWALLLTHPQLASKVLDLLSFWFFSAPKSVYWLVLERFFLELPGTLDDMRKERGFNETTREISRLAARQGLAWYPVMQDLFSERRSMFVSVGNLAKRLGNQNEDDAAKARAKRFNDQVSKLFEGKRIATTHSIGMRDTYTLAQRQQFWPAYWEQFTTALITLNPQQSLDLLSFWFNDAFKELESVPFVVPDFFLGLYDALEAAQKEKGFREAAQRINSLVGQQRADNYLLYPLMQQFFS